VHLEITRWESAAVIDLVQDRYEWQAIVDTAWSFEFHEMCRMSWLAENLLASQEGLQHIELVIFLIDWLGTQHDIGFGINLK
jgi:hypothetical protein